MADDETPDPTGSAAVRAVAGSTSPSAGATANALAFFMGEEPAPGSEDLVTLRIDFGAPGAPDFRECVFRLLDNEEFVAAAQAAQVSNGGGDQRIDPFVNWSLVFAYACVKPDLAAILADRRARGDLDVTGQPFADTAAIVRSVFRKRTGPLRAVVDRLDAESRTSERGENLVQQVEAGKGSP